MVGRAQVAQVVAEDQSSGTGFLIAPDKLVTALHVVVRMNEDEVVLDDRRRPISAGPLSCTFFSPERGHWTRPTQFDPSRDAYALAGDWVILTVDDTEGAHVWSCGRVDARDVGSKCASFGFTITSISGIPLHGKLAAVDNPLDEPAGSTVSVLVHNARFEELTSGTGHSPQGCSGAPVVVADRVCGILRSFCATPEDLARGGLVNVTPIEALQPDTGPSRRSPPLESDFIQRLRRLPPREIRRLTQPRGPACPRDALLDDLARRLTPVSHCVALLGPPETGKRWLARAYAHSRLTEYTTVWQVRGSSRTTITLDLAALAVELGLAESTSDPQAARDVGHWLRLTHRWLLIIEDLESIEDLHSLVPLHGPGHTLLVAAASLELPDWIERVTVPALDLDNAAGLLRAIAGWQDETIVDELLAEIGTLPGELRWAGQLARTFGREPAQLLASLRDSGGTRHGALVAYVQRTVTEPALLGLLTLCAYLGPVAIPLSVFERMARRGPDLVREILPANDELIRSIASLEELGLATCTAGYVHVDPKVVRTARWATRQESERWENITLALVAALAEGQGFVHRANAGLDVAFVPLLRHVIDTVAWNDDRQDLIARALTLSANAYKQYSGEAQAAISEYNRALEFIESCAAPKLVNLAGIYLNVGVTHARQGEHALALAAFSRSRSLFADAPGDTRKHQWMATLYIAQAQTSLRSLEVAAKSWAAWFAGLDEHAPAASIDLLITLREYCTSLPTVSEDERELAAHAPEHFACIQAHLDPEQRYDFTLLAVRVAAHLFALGLDEPGERMRTLSQTESAIMSLPQQAFIALYAALMLRAFELRDRYARERARADILLEDPGMEPARRAWHLCVHAGQLLEFEAHAEARREWVLALEALELQPDAQLTAAATCGLANSLINLGEFDAAETLCEAKFDELEGELGEGLFFQMLDLAERHVSTDVQRAFANYDVLVMKAEDRFGSSAPATQRARGTAAQMMMDHGEPRRALPHARAFAETLLAEPVPPGLQARALGVVIRLQFRCGDLSGARATLTEVIELLDARPPSQPDDMREAADLLSQLGVDFACRRMLKLGLEVQVRGFVLYRACQLQVDEQMLGRANNVAFTLEHLGRLEEARIWYERSVRLARELGHRRWREVNEANVARVRAGH